MRMWNFALLYFLISLSTQQTYCSPPPSSTTYTWNHGSTAKRTYMLTTIHWWESLDHQMTTIISLLTLAQNTSSIAVIPTIPTTHSFTATNKSLLGDYFDLEGVSRVQPALTFGDFIKSDDYKRMKEEKAGTIPLPKNAQEEYEARLGLLGKLEDAFVSLHMPAVDPENTNQKCDRFGGTMHTSRDGEVRYVFLDRLHFAHFCTEKFMPWWYDIRHRIRPKVAYYQAAEYFLRDRRRPSAVIHVSDLMENQKEREGEEIERYARQIVDELRKHEAIEGSLYVIHAKNGRHVKRVIHLLKQEFNGVLDCDDFFDCARDVPHDIFNPTLTLKTHDEMFDTTIGKKMLEWALSCQADLFIGNIHSPYSRNVCLHRKTTGKPYSIIRGFGELRKIWQWNL